MMVAEFVEDRPWVIPVGIGGVIGAVVLVSRMSGGDSGMPSQALPVRGQEAGEGEPGMDAIVSGLIESFSESQAAGFEALEQQQAARSEALSQELAARSESLQSQLDAFMESWTGEQDDPPDGEGSVSSGPPLLDHYRTLFANAFSPRELGGNENNKEEPGSGIVVNNDHNWRYYRQYGHYVSHGFRGYFEDHGGHEVFGAPRSEEFRDTDGKVTQVFSRAIMKHDPDSAEGPHHVEVIPLY